MQNGFPSKKWLPENKTGCSTSPRNKTINTDRPKPARAIIPTKDNIPAEMTNWLSQFQVRHTVCGFKQFYKSCIYRNGQIRNAF